MDDRRLLVEFLHAETLHEDSQMRISLNQVFQFGVLAFTILGAAAPILVKQKQYAALLVLAPVALAVWLLTLRVLVELFALVGNKQWLEGRLQRLVNNLGAGPVFVPWDDAAGQVTSRSIANAAVFACFAVGAGVVSGGSLAIAWQKLPQFRTWVTLDAVACGLLAVAALASAIQLTSVASRTKRLLEIKAGQGECPPRALLGQRGHRPLAGPDPGAGLRLAQRLADLVVKAHIRPGRGR